ncbi:MAG: ADP-ribosylglycohydrolase family protein [Sphaerospermopsis sp. SIO1G1]|nr:ADP-ribosylglycohydrolase family protein [Sphaerospermopsis sp. SIO1G1]
MYYSLVNRVRGAFLGLLLGEILADPNSRNLSAIAVLGSESLIRLGRLDIDDWLHFYQKQSFNSETGDIPRVKIVLATLPLAVFFHENTDKLKNNLIKVLQIWDTELVVRDVALIFAYVISISLTKTLNPSTLISQIISLLGETTTEIPQKLFKVQVLLENGTGLKQVQTEFSRPELGNYIALALYCFFSNQEDFHLALLRSQGNFGQHSSRYLDPQMVGILTGVLSGAYNGTTAIPVNWQMVLSKTDLLLWEQSIFTQILKLANDLVAVWSGAYSITPHTRELFKEECQVNWDTNPMSVTAAPSVIRSR